MVELGRNVFFGGIGLIFVVVIGLLLIGAVGAVIAKIFEGVTAEDFSLEEIMSGILQLLLFPFRLLFMWLNFVFNPKSYIEFFKRKDLDWGDKFGRILALCFPFLVTYLIAYGLVVALLVPMVLDFLSWIAPPL